MHASYILQMNKSAFNKYASLKKKTLKMLLVAFTRHIVSDIKKYKYEAIVSSHRCNFCQSLFITLHYYAKIKARFYIKSTRIIKNFS